MTGVSAAATSSVGVGVGVALGSGFSAHANRPELLTEIGGCDDVAIAGDLAVATQLAQHSVGIRRRIWLEHDPVPTPA